MDGASAEPTVLGGAGLEDVVRAKLGAFLAQVAGYPVHDLYDSVIALVERPLLELVLEHTGGNQLRASEMLGLNRNTLRKKLCAHGLSGVAKCRHRATDVGLPSATHGAIVESAGGLEETTRPRAGERGAALRLVGRRRVRVGSARE